MLLPPSLYTGPGSPDRLGSCRRTVCRRTALSDAPSPSRQRAMEVWTDGEICRIIRFPNPSHHQSVWGLGGPP